MIIKSSVHVSECDSVRMCECTHGEVPVVAAGPPPSLTLPVCVVLLQPSTAFCRAQLRPAANSSDYLAEPLNSYRRPLFLDQKREVGKIKLASWEGFVPTYLLLPRSLIKKKNPLLTVVVTTAVNGSWSASYVYYGSIW